jgi:probable addiction module antidote protein
MTTAMQIRDINKALMNDDQSAFLQILSDECRKVGMSEIARRTGLQREALYKPFRPGAQPRFETIAKIVTALDLKFAIASAESKR